MAELLRRAGADVTIRRRAAHGLTNDVLLRTSSGDTYWDWSGPFQLCYKVVHAGADIIARPPARMCAAAMRGLEIMHSRV